MLIKLSILLCTIPNRVTTTFPKIIQQLIDQTNGRDDVEVLALFDNKKRSVGAKRNALLQAAQGEYVAFIDDDDTVEPDYVFDLMTALYANPDCDCVSFDISYHKDGVEQPILSRHTAWSTMQFFPRRTEFAKKYAFPDMNVGEDVAWVRRGRDHIKKLVSIHKVLYNYNCNSKASVQTNTA